MPEDFINLQLALRSMRDRVPWRVASRILALHGFPRGRGWKETLDKSKDESTPSVEQLEALKKHFIEHIICGEKSVRFYRADAQEMDALREHLLRARIRKTDLSKSYPWRISDERLDSLPPSGPQLVSVEHLEDGVAAVFASIRATEVRETIDPADMPEQAKRALGDISEVVVVKVSKTQAFDVVWIPHVGSRVDVRCDLPFGMPQESTAAAHEVLRRQIGKVIGGTTPVLPDNLFPIMDQIYRTAGEGTVVELAFITTTASWKHERMRRRRLCLREEMYHRGGTDAVDGQIVLFKLSVEWAVPFDANRSSYPELNLHGTIRSLHGSEPTLHEGVIRKSAGITDFEVVRAKIESYLTESETDG